MGFFQPRRFCDSSSETLELQSLPKIPGLLETPPDNDKSDESLSLAW